MAKGATLDGVVLPRQPLRYSAPALALRWAEMAAWADAVHDPQRVEELHNMRIAAKRLRYTLEIFAPVLGDTATPLLKIVEEIQERLGLIHDCDVLFPLLTDTIIAETRRERGDRPHPLGPPPFLAAEGLAALLARKRAERQGLYDDFLRFWDSLMPEWVGATFDALVATATAKDNDAAN